LNSSSDSVSNASGSASNSSNSIDSRSSSSNSSFGFATFLAIEALGEIFGTGIGEAAGYGF
jgi:hypothetical protein